VGVVEFRVPECGEHAEHVRRPVPGHAGRVAQVSLSGEGARPGQGVQLGALSHGESLGGRIRNGGRGRALVSAGAGDH
jgi:hypothetical protein